jgi:hypothetical protein
MLDGVIEQVAIKVHLHRLIKLLQMWGTLERF